MKNVIVALTCLLFFGCDSNQQKPSQAEEEKATHSSLKETTSSEKLKDSAKPQVDNRSIIPSFHGFNLGWSKIEVYAHLKQEVESGKDIKRKSGTLNDFVFTLNYGPNKSVNCNGSFLFQDNKLYHIVLRPTNLTLMDLSKKNDPATIQKAHSLFYSLVSLYEKKYGKGDETNSNPLKNLKVCEWHDGAQLIRLSCENIYNKIEYTDTRKRKKQLDAWKNRNKDQEAKSLDAI